ncbi:MULTISPECIES: arsenical pump-driving ATPase [unclassified Rhodococcus (in: high G+C Gram-positive bacteria)]|uniref:arsenical pump-driving ATPase n=1 Tax=unclassified Rhodococcus (in: high G+C Gram-positive bacteria) TaxID=192944 RepID=UPI001639B910|nr:MULTISPECIES: arsenical pump-driving ATPase [unclassified Rhodococcus (in: high G+C Gram-positive bacteria)]MBC2644912.1 arsenical pump-driving ATPase [Rhodococcus sp. 3A]MBC2890914.1 arsenical pump-driving ATPase [Rhodococcus sp. 4CII]
MKFLHTPPRFLFFTGKGGVGKTSIACAAAISLARAGKRVLLVSTDPASNVGQVFGLTIGNTITDVRTVPGLSALEIDPEQAADAYRERIIGPVRGLLPEKELASITEQLSGSCTTEIASFNEFTALLTDHDTVADFDHVLFDTAPTGHTIRLLQLPGSWTDFLNEGKGDASCLGPMSGLEKQRSIYADAVAALADPRRTRLVLVARAQRSPLTEIARTHTELADIGLTHQHVVINGVLPTPTGGDELASAIHQREQAALAALPADLAGLPLDQVELKATNMVGISALEALFTTNPDTPQAIAAEATPLPDAPLSALVDELAEAGHGLIMCMGKGGVGKTTLAAAIAVALAKRGHQVHLTTTDPAAHLTDTLDGNLEGLTVSRIDPAEATAAYRQRVLATKGAALDEQGLATLAEDLASPCTEEVAVFQAFSRIIHESRRRFVVVDTAPTGHTLLLLDATGSYHREITRQMGDSTNFTTPLMRLQNPNETKVLLVTLAETTPRLEAEGLQADLQRAGIAPWAWVVNNSLAAAAPTSPLLRQRAATELEEIGAVTAAHPRFAVVPKLATDPVGVDALTAMVGAAQTAPVN